MGVRLESRSSKVWVSEINSKDDSTFSSILLRCIRIVSNAYFGFDVVAFRVLGIVTSFG
jgi:hypothetical protein